MFKIDGSRAKLGNLFGVYPSHLRAKAASFLQASEQPAYCYHDTKPRKLNSLEVIISESKLRPNDIRNKQNEHSAKVQRPGTAVYPLLNEAE